jgi:hypothetical protein
VVNRFILTLATVVIVAGTASSETRTLSAPDVSLEQRSKTDGSAYYLLQFSLPVDFTLVRHAWLELRMGISSVDVEGFRDPAPRFDVFALKQPLTGDPSEELFASTRIPMSRPVGVSANRLVRIDVTEFVLAVLADQMPNHGLVLGALLPGSRGVFEIGSAMGDATLVLIE